MLNIKEIKDRPSEIAPSVEEMRASQKAGSEGAGLPENSTGRLNECQGHPADVKE
jgi:hypothetical protein